MTAALDAAHRTQDATIRRRRDEDVAPLVDVLWAQQPQTRYPVRDSLPFPVEEFLHAHDAAGAWTVELDGRALGHACWVPTVAASDDRGVDPTGRLTTAAEACAAAHGCGVDELAWVSSLFLAPELRGMGLASRLLATVVADVQGAGRHPCLEVVDLNPAALRRYRADGWREVLRAHPAWLRAATGDATLGTTTMVRPIDA
ncbi:GNAT family N-acetyltransferase [Agrococcus sp. SGAir0287]|uniref:GNAT family N-acetyltransferase n=1 Tax=Agrococcus sp. SGAir0287 TaxID=2070347 RepID=UPI0010CD3B8B|nr:GNAT family N-acetyltransferase [Agrococcus sp. SGAir0287]QCR18742.1 GNAT family N-acetyltransferase [Agrococcus sp. SGAir0287]